MIAQFSILPVGTTGTSLRAHVAKAIEETDASGLVYRVTAMGTIVEGEWDAVMALLKKVRSRVLENADRVYLTISIDERKDKIVTLDSKMRALEAVVGRSLCGS